MFCLIFHYDWNWMLPEVNISPKISISAQPLKMALHRNPAMHGSRMVIFLHASKKALFSTIKSSFSAQFKRKLAKLARYHIIHCIAFYFFLLVWFGQIQIVAAHDWITHNSTWRLSLTNIFARNPLI